MVVRLLHALGVRAAARQEAVRESLAQHHGDAVLTCMLVWPTIFGGIQEMWTGPDAAAICAGSQRMFPVMYATERAPDRVLCREAHVRADGTIIVHQVGQAFGTTAPSWLNYPNCHGDGSAAW